MSEAEEFLFIGGVSDGKFIKVPPHITHATLTTTGGIEYNYKIQHLTDGTRDWRIYLLNGVTPDSVMDRVKELLGIEDV